VENPTWILTVLGLMSLCASSIWLVAVSGLLIDVENDRSSESPSSGDSTGSVADSPQPDNVIALHAEFTEMTVMFNWNGHMWEAHEVLGVVVGASLSEIEQAFNAECETVDPHSRAFLKMALRSLQERKKAGASNQRNK
jgi:hypothetical protein